MPKFESIKENLTQNSFTTQVSKAIWLLKRLWALKITKIFLVFLFILIVSPIIAFLYLRPVAVKNITYGVNFSHKYASDLGMDWKYTYAKLLDDLGAKHFRLVAYWDEIEREKDVYDYEIIKYQLDEAKKRDAKVILLLGYKTVRYPECYSPVWWEDLPEEQKKVELYSYVRTTINELKGYDNIIMWQVENEPFFPFGECEKIEENTLKEEIRIVRDMDGRPILVQDSGEGGLWKKTYDLGDYLGISMYRKIWYDFWGALLGNFIYFEYPLAHWTYKIKADIVGVPHEKIIVTELQGEPWGPGINSSLTQEEKDISFSRLDFLDTLSYAQKAGFSNLYLWGAEWWLWEAERNDNPYFWNTAKALYSHSVN